MTNLRRSPRELEKIGIDALVAALGASDIAAGQVLDDRNFDALVDVTVDDRPIRLGVEVKAYCTGSVAREAVSRIGSTGSPFPVMVADRITAEARQLLSDSGWSWLDRRGRLHLRGPAVRVDVDVPISGAEPHPTTSGPAVKGRGGIGVAYWLCSRPGETLSPTKDAPTLGVAPSTVSEAVAHLRDAGIVDDRGIGVFPELFWELAEAWRGDRTWIATEPRPGQHRPPDPQQPGWRRTGTAAAAAYGAPIVAPSPGPLELYVVGPVEISIAVRHYGAAEPGAGAAALAVAPTQAVVANAGDRRVPRVSGWPAAPVLAVALDLAQDRARGREILEDWRHPDAVWR